METVDAARIGSDIVENLLLGPGIIQEDLGRGRLGVVLYLSLCLLEIRARGNPFRCCPSCQIGTRQQRDLCQPTFEILVLLRRNLPDEAHDPQSRECPRLLRFVGIVGGVEFPHKLIENRRCQWIDRRDPERAQRVQKRAPLIAQAPPFCLERRLGKFLQRALARYRVAHDQAGDCLRGSIHFLLQAHLVQRSEVLSVRHDF